ncbi:MAG: phenylalanine--tRNA ligase subunit alpha [Thermoanaerobaculia bacterium]
MSGEAAATPGGPQDLAALERRFEEEAAGVEDREAWEALRLQWAGRKQGRLRHLLAALKDLPAGERRAYGEGVNALKERVETRLAALDEALSRRERQAAVAAAAEDVTLPGRRPQIGRLHPVTLVLHDLETIFRGLGYSVAEGPEVEDDYHNFGALNFPPDHPARDEQDTLFLKNGLLLRTHTSPVQIRTMLARKPPIRILCPGRCYRHDNTLRHSPMFHQVECLHVDKGISLAHLKGTLLAMARGLFSPDTGVRLRPSYFPFTEPSCEVDITCPFCHGDGCATCSQSGWIEILGSGMVDPRVLAECGIDPDRYSGFAFGMGLDRVAMIRHGISNIRLLFDGDQRLLAQVRA